MKDETVIGIDLGGTGIKSVVVTYPGGETLHRGTRPTCDGEFTEDGQPVFAAHVVQLIDQHEAKLGHPARAVGLSAPGLVAKRGDAIAVMPGRMFGLDGLRWRDALGRNHPVPVLNDAHAALMGEIWLGAARGLEDVVMFTLGTGVGGAIVSGGRLLIGRFGRAGHLGHVTVDYRGEPDLCNTPGSIENAIGEKTLSRRSGGAFTTTEALVASYAAGEEPATTIWLESLRALAAAIVSMANAVDPEVVVLGGGITSAGEHLFGPLRPLVAEREWRPGGARVRLCQAELGTWAGAYGAAYHAMQSQASA